MKMTSLLKGSRLPKRGSTNEERVSIDTNLLLVMIIGGLAAGQYIELSKLIDLHDQARARVFELDLKKSV